MKTRTGAAVSAAVVAAILVAALLWGSVNVSITDIFAVIGARLGTSELPPHISAVTAAVIWNIRLPRLVMALLTGAALALSGAVMQSVLRNPLASAYTLGVSSGASLAAALVAVSGLSLTFPAGLSIPLAGFIGALLTVAAALALTLHYDRTMENNTVILVGLVLSLFVNALLTLVTAFSGDSLRQLVFRQMGSFEGQSWHSCAILAAVLALSLPLLLLLRREMDLLGFGEEQAGSAGVEVRRVKLLLLTLSALLAGTAVAFVGVIGFVDMIAPHIVRRSFGGRHRVLLPLSALYGGGLMLLADLLSRVVMQPRELPVGAVTALIGAPFFAYVWFHRRKEEL